MALAPDNPAALLDLFACEQLVRRFALLNDAGDHDALAELFVAHGSFARPTDPDNPVRGREAIRAFFRDRPRRLTRHVMVNTVVDLDGDNRARASSYVLLYAATDPSAALPARTDAPLLVGSFDDSFERTDAGWRFLDRRGSLALSHG